MTFSSNKLLKRGITWRKLTFKGRAQTAHKNKLKTEKVKKKKSKDKTSKLKSDKKKKKEEKKKKKANSPINPVAKSSKKKKNLLTNSSKKSKKKKKKKESTKSFAHKSIVENENIASETLAELLADQGSPDKAIRMYERLSLIFPEKSTFFAKRIEKLKNI